MPLISITRHVHNHHHYSNPHLEGQILAVSAQVQQALDGIRQTQDLLKSYEAANALVAQKVADQGTLIAQLQAQIAAGGAPLGADDLAALAETNADIAAVNTSLAADVPANTGSGIPSGQTAAGQTQQPAPAPAPDPAPVVAAPVAPTAGASS